VKSISLGVRQITLRFATAVLFGYNAGPLKVFVHRFCMANLGLPFHSPNRNLRAQ